MSFQTNTAILSKEAKQAFTKTKIKEALRSVLNCLVDVEDPFSGNLTPAQFRDTYLYHMMFDKYVELNTADAKQRRDACIEKYMSCEARCRDTNERMFNSHFRGTKHHHTIMLLREEIQNVLGVFHADYLTEGSFGPGATTRLGRPFIDGAFKFEGSPHITSRLLPFAQCLYSNVVWKSFTVVEDAKFTTVPKNAKIDRPIEIQPDINIFFQKSLGNVIRNRMKGRPIGYLNMTIDLNDQSINRELARLGSQYGELATLDLSSASDMIATGFLFQVLPDDWFHALDICRVPRVQIEGKTLTLEKFSAMGNGYTWELQSMLFYCMVRAVSRSLGCSEHVAATFGDDIICLSEIADSLVEFLDYCGFSVNTKKSFIRGPFRESCGKHYYEGLDVSPVYLRAPINTDFDLIKFYNRLFEWATQLGFKDSRFKEYLGAIRFASKYHDCVVPLGAGDCGFAICFDDLHYTPTYQYKNWVEHGFVTRVINTSRSTLSWQGPGALLKRLHGCCGEEPASEIPFGNERSVVQWSGFRTWPRLGGWA